MSVSLLALPPSGSKEKIDIGDWEGTDETVVAVGGEEGGCRAASIGIVAIEGRW